MGLKENLEKVDFPLAGDELLFKANEVYLQKKAKEREEEEIKRQKNVQDQIAAAREAMKKTLGYDIKDQWVEIDKEGDRPIIHIRGQYFRVPGKNYMHCLEFRRDCFYCNAATWYPIYDTEGLGRLLCRNVNENVCDQCRANREKEKEVPPPIKEAEAPLVVELRNILKEKVREKKLSPELIVEFYRIESGSI